MKYQLWSCMPWKDYNLIVKCEIDCETYFKIQIQICVEI